MAKKKAAMLVVLMMALSLVAGCKGGSGSSDALARLTEAAEAMSGTSCYRMKGDIEMSMGEGAAPIAMSLRADVQNAPDGMRQHMFVSMGGFEAEAYVVGDTYYQNSPGQGWQKMSLGLYRVQNMNTGLVDAEQMELMAKMASDSRVMEEKDGSIGIAFHLGKEYFDASMRIYREYMEESGEGVPEEWLKMMEESVSDFSADIKMWLNASNQLVERMEIVYSMGGIPQLGEMRSSMRMDLYDYDADIEVELPPEAAQAEEIKLSP